MAVVIGPKLRSESSHGGGHCKSWPRAKSDAGLP